MQRTKSHKYTIVHPDGRITFVRVPEFFTPFEVAKRLCHSLIFLHVKGNSIASTRNAGFVKGPCVVLVYNDDEWALYNDAGGFASEAPISDHEALAAWRSIQPFKKQITA